MKSTVYKMVQATGTLGNRCGVGPLVNNIATVRLLRVFTFHCLCIGACEGSGHELGSQSWAYGLCIVEGILIS